MLRAWHHLGHDAGDLSTNASWIQLYIPGYMTEENGLTPQFLYEATQPCRKNVSPFRKALPMRYSWTDRPPCR